MEQLKVLILVSLAIMTLNSCNGQQKETNTNNIISGMVANDTILLSKAHFEIVSQDSNTLDVKITDVGVLKHIENAVSPVFRIDINKEVVIAKGNNIFNSSVPNNCDYFYPLNNDKMVVLYNNQINFRKIN